MEKELLLELRRLGLTAVEARVYSTLLTLGGAEASVVSRKAGVPRTNCYYTLKSLSQKGLVSVTSQGRMRYFLAENPRKLVLEQHRKLSIAEGLLPSLLALERVSPGRAPRMKYYEGYAGSLTVLHECAQARGEILIYTNLGMLLEKFPDLVRERSKRKATLKLLLKIISPSDERGERFLEEHFPPEYVRECVQLLLVSRRHLSISSEVAIFDDKVSVVSLGAEENLGVVIESQTYADTMRATFNLAWLGAGSFEAR